MPLKHLGSPSGQACSIRFDARFRPTALIGRVTPKTTTGRPGAPPPISGFVTDYTPFDRGHIMGLELNGPDVSENIVPQYRHWQETGAWRAMEESVSKHHHASGAIFAVELDYTDHPDTYTSLQARFRLNEVFSWAHPCIPDAFRIWFIIGSDLVATKVETTLLRKAVVLEKDFTDCWIAIKTRAVHATFDHTVMPNEDVLYWRNLQVGIAANAAFANYKAERVRDMAAMDVELTRNPVPGLSTTELVDARKVTRSPPRGEMEFIRTQQAPIKRELETTWHWAPSETAALDGGRVMKACVGKPNQRDVKTWDTQHNEYVKTYNGTAARHTELKNKRVPYAAPAFRGSDKY